MKKRIFVSYSSPDQEKADKLRQALEFAGIGCWIAPRDLSAGTQWGAGIVEAINECEAVLVVFSAAANNSPQVAREMELAVSKRRPLIPIRVADDQPTNDMQYFLGVSHWFNAYAKPLDGYLPQIVGAVQNVLARESSPWTGITKRLPKTRAGQVVWGAAGAVAIAVIVSLIMRPSLPGPIVSPLAGRWEADMPDARGGKTECVLDVQKDGQAVFSDGCPAPLMDSRGVLNALKQSIWAPDLFQSGDTGSFTFMGGAAHGFVAAFKIGFFGGLTTRDSKFGTVKWSKISSGGKIKSAMDDIVPHDAGWPLADMPGIAKRARDYVRAKWKSDAELLSIDVKLLKSNESGIANITTSEGGIELKFRFYSPDSQEGLQFTPSSRAGALFPLGVIERYGGGAIPDDFVDLPDAVSYLKARGMRAKQIYEAQLENWGAGTSYGSARLGGVQWMIDSQLDERFVVAALK
jgi:TIR domain